MPGLFALPPCHSPQLDILVLLPEYRCNFITMHCTAFTSFPKPLALNVACDNAIFRRLHASVTAMVTNSLDLCAAGPLPKPDRDQVMKKNNNICCCSLPFDQVRG